MTTRFMTWTMKELRALDELLIEVRGPCLKKLEAVYNELHAEIDRRVKRNRT